MAGAVPSALRLGGAKNKLLRAVADAQENFFKTLHKQQAVATTTPAATTVPPAFLRALAFREANLQEQINLANRTLNEDEKRLADITASVQNVTANIGILNATVAADKQLMTGTTSILTHIQTYNSRTILEGKYNNVAGKLAQANLTAKNISVAFGAAKGAKADTKSIEQKFEALNTTVLLNGSSVAELLNNFSQMEEVLSYNVSEYIYMTVERHTEDIFRNISQRFADMVESQTKAIKENRPCDIVNITLCNLTNATKAATSR